MPKIIRIGSPLYNTGYVYKKFQLVLDRKITPITHLISFFLNYRDVKHGRYLEKLREKYGPRECKNKFMFHRDRDALLKYLSGGPTPENVSRKTRRELNPEQFVNTRKRISPPSRYVFT